MNKDIPRTARQKYFKEYQTKENVWMSVWRHNMSFDATCYSAIVNWLLYFGRWGLRELFFVESLTLLRFFSSHSNLMSFWHIPSILSVLSPLQLHCSLYVVVLQSSVNSHSHSRHILRNLSFLRILGTVVCGYSATIMWKIICFDTFKYF